MWFSSAQIKIAWFDLHHSGIKRRFWLFVTSAGDHCADPGVPAGASRSGNSFGIGDTVRYRCINKLFLMGSEERVCQENGQWTGIEPSCYCKTLTTHQWLVSFDQSMSFQGFPLLFPFSLFKDLVALAVSLSFIYKAVSVPKQLTKEAPFTSLLFHAKSIVFCVPSARNV